MDKKLLILDDPDVIVTSFQALGTFDLSQNDFTNGKLPTSLVPLEAFVCKVYAPKIKIESIPMLRWELYRSRNLEGEKLPPTLATFFPRVMKYNLICKRDKSYVQSHPNLPPLDRSGWEPIGNDEYVPLKCLIGPAPTEVL